MWIKTKMLCIKVSPVERMAAPQIVLRLGHDDLSSSGRPYLDVAKPNVAELRLDSMNTILLWKLFRKSLWVHDY